MGFPFYSEQGPYQHDYEIELDQVELARLRHEEDIRTSQNEQSEREYYGHQEVEYYSHIEEEHRWSKLRARVLNVGIVLACAILIFILISVRR